MTKVVSHFVSRWSVAPWRLGLGVAVVAAAITFGTAAPAHAELIYTVTPVLPATVALGAQNVPGSIVLSNQSTAPQVGNVDITDIRLYPGCSAPTPTLDCGNGTPEVVFTVDSPAFGRTGTGCEGIVFTVTFNAALKRYEFTPDKPFGIQPPSSPGHECDIDFTFDVVSMPQTDVDPAMPGVQTNAVAAVKGTNANDKTDATFFGWQKYTVTQAHPTVATQAVTPAAVGSPISDTATLSGGVNPTGTITFNLYGPNDATCATPIFTNVKPVNGNGNYTSDPFTPTTAGTYRWVAAYSGDANNSAVSGACNDANESSVVTMASPTLVTSATPSANLGQPISDTATLSSGFNPTGTITFNVFGPNNATCAGTPVFTSAKPVNGNGNYSSDPFTPTTAGTYRWVAAYSGDANNNAVSGACNDANESSVVAKSVSGLSTSATPTATIGQPISDTGTLSGGTSPTGTMTFNAYGPNDATCTGPAAFTSTVPVNGNGNYSSGNFTPTSPGTYRWIAAYSGDANNTSKQGACNDPNENSVVSKAAPGMSTTATSSATVGQPIADTATLSGGTTPTGTMTFNAYGPNDATCAGPAVFTSTVPVNGNGNYQSGNFTPTSPGTYRWIAAYSGDANNNARSGACNDPNENSVVSKAAPALSTNATPSATIGQSIADTATLSGGTTPTGTMTFNAYGPNDATCAGPSVFTSTVPVNGNGNYQSGNFTPTSAGTYRWVAAYSGDANNNARSGACNDPNENSVVSKAAPTLSTNATPTAAVGQPITDTATLSGGVAPTGSITFNVYPPTDALCAGTPEFTSTVPVSGNGNYTSGAFTPTTTGTHRWTAQYSGDANNNAASDPCGSPNESTQVTKARPDVDTTASMNGMQTSDTAVLEDGVNPTGTLRFDLFGPNNPGCLGAPVFTSTVPVNGNGTYKSATFTASQPGTYRWVATYSGDANNEEEDNACGDPFETVRIAAADPTTTSTTPTTAPTPTTTPATTVPPTTPTTSTPAITTPPTSPPVIPAATPTTLRTAAQPATQSQLQRTGSDVGMTTLLGIVLLATGACVARISRRPRKS